MAINGNKAVGPDGFLFKFALSFWPKVKGKVLNLFRDGRF